MERIIKEHTFYDDYLKDELTIIDLGACLGEFSDEIDKQFNLKKSILVEAGPMNFLKLIKKDNYVLYNNLISSHSNQVYDFYEDPASPYNGSTMFRGFKGVFHKIISITLEDIIKQNQIVKIDLMKIDIEGSEYDVLLNTPKEIFEMTKQITVEFHDFLDSRLKQETKKVFDRMVSFGFEILQKRPDNYDVLFYKK